jgi:hypothetical protein
MYFFAASTWWFMICHAIHMKKLTPLMLDSFVVMVLQRSGWTAEKWLDCGEVVGLHMRKGKTAMWVFHSDFEWLDK